MASMVNTVCLKYLFNTYLSDYFLLCCFGDLSELVLPCTMLLLWSGGAYTRCD